MIDACEFCQEKFSDMVKPIVDHCPETAFVRGTLCENCYEWICRTPKIRLDQLTAYINKFEMRLMNHAAKCL